MNPDFKRWRSELSLDDLKSFEALCFRKADIVLAAAAILVH
jgi:hypothetical protein